MSRDAIFVCYRDAASENNLRASSVKVEMRTDNKHKERLKVVIRPAGNLSHIIYQKNHFARCCYLKFQWNRLHLFSSGQSGAPSDLRVVGVQELLLGRCDAAIPGAGAVCPLDAGVVVGLASVHLLLDHQVRPQTLLRSRDLAGQRGTAHDLQRQNNLHNTVCTEVS